MRIYILISFIISSLSYASVSLEWEINLLENSIITGNGDLQVETVELSDGGGLLIVTYQGYRDEYYKITVVDKSGNVFYSYSIPYYASNPSGALRDLNILTLRNRNFIIYDIKEGLGDFQTRFHDLYTYSDGTYQIHSLGVVDQMLPFTNFDYSRGSINHSDSENYYIAKSIGRTNAVIQKYSFASFPSQEIVSGHVSSGFFQDNYVLNWESGLGIQYQIQSSTNLVDWTPVGQVLTGTGYPMTWANHITNSQSFYRVVED